MTKNSSTGKGRLSCEQADAIKRDLQVVCRCFQSQFHNDVQQQDGDEEMIEISENISYFTRQEQRSISAYLSQLFLSHHRLLAEMLTCSMKCSLSWFLDRWVAGSRDQIQIGKNIFSKIDTLQCHPTSLVLCKLWWPLLSDCHDYYAMQAIVLFNTIARDYERIEMAPKRQNFRREVKI